MRIKLEVVSGPMDGHIFQFNHNVDLGREGKLRVPVDRFISRRHLCLEIDGSRLFVEDLNSTNGTFLDEERLEGKAELNNGQVFRVGRTWLEVSC